MALTELLPKGNGWVWADTSKSANIKYKIGEPLHWVVPPAHKEIIGQTLGTLLDTCNLLGRQMSLPKGTEMAYQVLEKCLDAVPPYLMIQYVEAKR
jgi:hypothetical protein